MSLHLLPFLIVALSAAGIVVFALILLKGGRSSGHRVAGDDFSATPFPANDAHLHAHMTAMQAHDAASHMHMHHAPAPGTGCDSFSNTSSCDGSPPASTDGGSN